jgi:serine/threonine protein kinase
VAPPHQPQDDPKQGPTRLRPAKADNTLVASHGGTRLTDETIVSHDDDPTLHAYAGDATLRDPLREESSQAAHTHLRPPAQSPGDDRIATASQQPTKLAGQPHAGTAARAWHAPSFRDPETPSHVRTLRAPRPIPVRPPQPLDEVAHDGYQGELQPGSVIKQRFLLDSLIGKGGMGRVFSAIDRRKEEAKDPNPQVALKVLNADFRRHEQSFMALQREARKAQTLAHPNVVTVFDFDRDGDAVYMTMELLKGRSLESMVREARGKGIGREHALPIIRGIAEGLAYAHRKGIVHSDLKPGNVFITADGTPKILDFGIARAVPNAASEEAPDVFDAGSLGAYTEAYATNEMVNGIDPHPADDMYALGIIAYELLTGFHPYQRHSAPSARKLGIKVSPLKGVKLREARAIERSLSFQRKDRPQDAGEFLQLFRGVSTIQKTSVTAAAILAIVSGYFWYQNYLETSPAIAFDRLPMETQQQFAGLIRQGNEEWTFYQRERNIAALQSAVEQYSRAYELHPRNREAVHGLRQAGDALLQAAKTDEERHEIAAFLREQSDYFRKYRPVIGAAD